MGDEALTRYGLLARQARDAILFMRRSDGRILEANDAACDLYGYSVEEMLSLTGYDLRTEAAAAQADGEIPKDRPFSLTLETEHRRKDGSDFPVECTLQSAYLDGEHVVLSIVRDVSQRRESERALRAALQQATQASRTKSEFVAAMSHEIRTPMNGVVGMIELLLDTPLNEQQLEFTSTLREAAHSLLGIIENVLDFSKIEAGKVELEIASCNVVAKIEGVAALVRPAAHAKKLSLMTYVDPSIPAQLFADEVRLGQVLANLAGNAVKFTDEGGLSLSADLLDVTADWARVRFVVRDTGIGIAADRISSLFEAFTQADGSTTRRYGGTGLGLTISEQLVALMGGTIAVESAPGRGSTFSFTLDLPTVPGEHAVRQELSNCRALVVDDDVMSRDILSRYANSWGVRAGVAETAQEALAMLREAARRAEPYDVAIVDLRLAHADGMDLGRAIKADASIASTHLILITAFDAPDLGRAAIEAGFSAYLTKPVGQSPLYDALAKALATPKRAPTASRRRPSARTNKRILLAEDNAVNRQVTMHQLGKLGYAARSAGDGRETLDRVMHEDVDLILMDCQMPNVDGFQATRAIRKLETQTGRHVPIVAMTANAMAGDRDACLSAGMDDYLTKPVVLDDLARVLSRWLGAEEADEVLDCARIADIFADDAPAMAEFFAMAIPAMSDLCRRVANTRERSELRELVHELKGAAGNVGAGELQAAARQLESELLRTNDDRLPAAGAILAACDRFVARAEQFTTGATPQ